MRWRSVIGFFAGRSFGSPLASKPSSTCGEARSGSSLPIGSSSESLPCSTSCMPAAHVIAERAQINHLAAGRRHRDHAGDLFGLAFLTQNLIDLGFALHGSPPALIFMEWRDLPPAGAIRQAFEKIPPTMSRSRDG